MDSQDLLSKKKKPVNDSDLAWMITSTTHDIAYPLDQINKWLPDTINTFLGEKSKDVKHSINIDRVIFSNENFLGIIDELVSNIDKTRLFPGVKSKTYRIWLINQIINRNDHGVLSALFLLASDMSKHQHILYPSALAISFHAGILKNTCLKINYNNNPLLFMLLYCDLIQEWGRDLKDYRSGTLKLEKIIVTRDIRLISEAVKNIPKEIREQDKTIYVYCHMVGDGNYTYKINECIEIMDRLESSNPYFIIRINNKLIYKT